MSDPEFQAHLELPDLSLPVVVAHEIDGTHRLLRLRYEYVGDLDSLARRIVGNRRLTWVQEVDIDSGSGIGTGSGPGRGEGERAGTGEETREGSVSLPILLDKVDPVYPIMAIRSRIEGTVILEIVVGPDGSVREIYIRQSVPMLDAAAIEAIKQWRYAPARTGRRPVQSTVMVRVNFVLR